MAHPDDSTEPTNFVLRHLASNPPKPAITLANVLENLEWFNLLALTGITVMAIYGGCTTELRWETGLFSVFFYFVTGLGITAGYHRLWAHRAYNASVPLQYALAIMGAGGVQGSAKWWARGHRAHHRYTDTELDPYSAHHGFWWAHIGWIIVKPRRKHGPVDISDLVKNDIVMWQHKNFIPLIILVSFVFPTVVPGLLWGDYRGGYFYAGLIRLCFVHHSTFCVNSLAHWLGESPFDDKHTAKDHFLTALVTIGEGYHNFHHEFPCDYRNAIRWYDFDPTKWFIYTTSILGWASHLRTFSRNEIAKGQYTMELKKLKAKEVALDWPVPSEELPIIGWQEYVKRAQSGNLIAIHGFVHDCSTFIDNHPGGDQIIRKYLGKDATAPFYGGVYDHSNAAQNLLAMLRVGVIDGGGEVEVLKSRLDEETSAESQLSLSMVPGLSSSSSLSSSSESLSSLASCPCPEKACSCSKLNHASGFHLGTSCTAPREICSSGTTALPNVSRKYLPVGKDAATVVDDRTLNIPPSERLRIVYSVPIARRL